MDNKKLNMLVDSFKKDNSDLTFNEIYEELSEVRRRVIGSSKYHGVDKSDVQAYFDDTLYECINKYDGQANFINFFNFSMKNKIISLKRKERVRSKNETRVLNEKGEPDNEILDALLSKQGRVEEPNNEDYLKVEDQRQLIGYLTENKKDPLTTAIVSEVLNDVTFRKFNPTAIGEKFNVSRTTVTRKLARLKKQYDSSIFGDYRDYLCG